METNEYPECFTTDLIVLTVPMRNGNIKQYRGELEQSVGSYRTYEEWKHGGGSVPIAVRSSSYRTYEEWKLGLCNGKQPHCSEVLTVPMRNGNPR